jgi:RNA polymerase sigma factor (sigma-70 family)
MQKADDQAGQLLARARSGDGDAFAALTGPFRRELQVHCYRIIGSVADAEDMLQETMMAAWRGLDRFGERSSLRTWLHAIATNKCLNHLRASRAAPLPAPRVPRPRDGDRPRLHRGRREQPAQAGPGHDRRSTAAGRA